MKLPMDINLTIILLLKGRDAFTIRWFEHAKEFKLPFHVIIADGGSDTGLGNELWKKKFHLNVSYEYVRYPYDANYKIFYEKILNALNKVETPYVVLASNDDFYFFDALNESVSFLNENAEYVSSRGELWDFSVLPTLKRGIGLEKSVIYGSIINISKLYKHPTVIGECAMERVVDYSSKANAIWHDVVRTKNLKEAYGALIESNINDLALYESLIGFVMASQGKIHRGCNLYMLHQCHPDMAALTDLADNPLDWIDAPGWDSDFNSFLDTVAVQISKVDQIAFYEAKCKMLKAYTDSILLQKMKDHILLLTSGTKNKTSATGFIKTALRKNKKLFGVLKIIHSLIPAKIVHNQIPSSFIPKIDVIANFLKK